jgi:hypothetical protein
VTNSISSSAAVERDYSSAEEAAWFNGLHDVALGLISVCLPVAPKGIRLVDITLSNFRSQGGGEGAELLCGNGKGRQQNVI